MSAPIEAPPDIGNLIASMGALFSAAPGERAEIIERWREHMREGRAGLQRQSQQFEALYKDVAEDRHLGFQGINDLAAAILEEQREAAKRILPAVEVLLKALAAHSDDPDLTLIFCEGLDISRITLENFGVLRKKLLGLGIEQSVSHEVLHARPIEGEVDHAALSREFMARFPKIRAALAK